MLEKFNIDMKYAHIDYNKPSNAFIIDEIQNSISLAQSHFLPIHIPNNLQANHLHVSCRRGVPFKEAFNKIQASSYSLDIMWSSVKDFLPELSECLNKTNFLFCNDTEYNILKSKGIVENFPKELMTMITDKNGVMYKKGEKQKYFKTVEISPTISTVGAGDTFLGQFLSKYHGDNLEQSIYHGLAAASISVQDYGNLHLFDKVVEIENAKNSIQNMDKQNDPRTYIYNRSIMQR